MIYFQDFMIYFWVYDIVFFQDFGPLHILSLHIFSDQIECYDQHIGTFFFDELTTCTKLSETFGAGLGPATVTPDLRNHAPG